MPTSTSRHDHHVDHGQAGRAGRGSATLPGIRHIIATGSGKGSRSWCAAHLRSWSSSTRPANVRLEISNQSLPGQGCGEALDDRCERF